MRIAGWFLQRFGYMTQERFLDNFITTVGRTIYVYEGFMEADGYLNLLHALETAPHEVTHVLQKIKAWRYLLSRAKLAKYEIPAYCANIEFHHFLTGEVLDPTVLANRLIPYGIERYSREYQYAIATYRVVGSMARKGRYKNRAVVEAIEFLKNR
jgi:hypothetical protein